MTVKREDIIQLLDEYRHTLDEAKAQVYRIEGAIIAAEDILAKLEDNGQE